MQNDTLVADGVVVRYVYSACVVIETPDARILCDPWFTEGIYDGSWFHFPVVEDPVTVIGDVDLVYVSHIHPDHYDPDFLRLYMDTFGEKRVIVADRTHPYLANALSRDGFSQVVVAKDDLIVGRTTVSIVAVRPDDRNEVDSALAVSYVDESGRRHSVVNVNDIVFDDQVRDELAGRFPHPDVLLLGYTGAGPYPQTYFDTSDPRLPIEAHKKKHLFFERYTENASAFGASVNIPFAGKYLLGGNRAHLNWYRGVADAAEVLEFDPRAVVLADQVGWISTVDFVPRGVRTAPYDESSVKARVDQIARASMAYELIDEAFVELIPFERLLRRAYANAIAVSQAQVDHHFVCSLPSGRRVLMNARRGCTAGFSVVDPDTTLPEPRSEIVIDHRYLYGLLTGVFHWNTAEVGSQYFVRRHPDHFDRSVQGFLNFLTV